MNQNPVASDWAAARGKKWCDHIAGMEATLASVDEPLIHALHLNAPCRIADVGCGGGGTTLEILRRAPVGSMIHGFDISPSLITLARDRIQSKKEGAIAFDIADIATAAAPEKPYDRMVSRFGVMFFKDPQAAFTNLSRWLALGGQFAFAVWGHPTENPWVMSVRDVVADIIHMPPSEPDTLGLFRYAEANKLLTLLARAGFGELDVQDWHGTLPIGGGLAAAAAAHFAIASFSSFGEQLAEAGDEALNEARQSLTAHFSQHQQNGVVQMDATVHIFTGVRLE